MQRGTPVELKHPPCDTPLQRLVVLYFASQRAAHRPLLADRGLAAGVHSLRVDFESGRPSGTAWRTGQAEPRSYGKTCR